MRNTVTKEEALKALGISQASFYNIKRWNADTFPRPVDVRERFYLYDLEELRAFISGFMRVSEQEK